MHSAGLTSTYVKPPLKVFCLQGICFEEIIWSKPLINAHYSDFWGTSILPPLHALIGETEGHICKRYRSSSIWSQAYGVKHIEEREQASKISGGLFLSRRINWASDWWMQARHRATSPGPPPVRTLASDLSEHRHLHTMSISRKPIIGWTDSTLHMAETACSL